MQQYYNHYKFYIFYEKIYRDKDLCYSIPVLLIFRYTHLRTAEKQIQFLFGFAFQYRTAQNTSHSSMESIGNQLKFSKNWLTIKLSLRWKIMLLLLSIYSTNNVPGQGVSLQFTVFVSGPSHCFPPFKGFWIMSLVMVLTEDAPHVALQVPSFHGPSLQSTKYFKIKESKQLTKIWLYTKARLS